MTSLSDYLKTRLLILGVVLLVPVLYLLFSLYELGLDDATELYLQQDMDWAIESLSQTGVLPTAQTGKRFAIGLEQLPTLYHSVAKTLPDDPYLFLQTADSIHYGLVGEWRGKAVFVIHEFPLDEPIEGLQLETIAMLMVLSILSIMVMGAWFMYRRISFAMRALEFSTHLHGMKDSTTGSSSTHEEAIAWFSEVYEVSHALKVALKQLQDKTQQERAFIQSLSHELRTPMAIIQVALDVLSKQTLEEKTKRTLVNISDANQRMQTLAQQLLAVWQADAETPKVRVSLMQHFDQAIASLDRQYHCAEQIRIQCHETVMVMGSELADQLVLFNLLKNAWLHGNGIINISLDSKGFVIVNPTGSCAKAAAEESVGMGLFIVDKALDVLGWRSFVEEDDEYRVTVRFDSAPK